jgi:hypothetical protein
MLDIHPEPEHSWVEVQTGDGVLPVGRLDESGLIDRIHAARAVLASLIDEGYFVHERETTFEFLYHFDSVDAWLAYMAEDWVSAVIPEVVVARAREVLVSGTGELRIREPVYAARLRRV